MKSLHIFRSSFVRNVAIVASGVACAQVITMAFAPLIARIYGPEAFGLLGTFMAIVTAAAPLAAFAYPLAIVMPRNDSEALGLVKLSIIISLATATIAGLFLWGEGVWLATALGEESFVGLLLFIPLAMVFSVWVQVAEQWLIRRKAFSKLAGVTVANSLLQNMAKTAVGWSYPYGAVLVVLTTVGYALHAAMLCFGARRVIQRNLGDNDEGKLLSMRELVHRHRDFPLYRAPQNFMNAVSQSLPVIMLAALFGPVSAGFYTLARIVTGMPSTLLGKAISDVFYPRITEAVHDGANVFQQILKATLASAVLGFFPFALVIVLGPWLFGVVFGPEWGGAGEYAQWLAPFFLFNFINKPSVAAVPVLKIQHGLLIFELFSTGGKVIGLFVGFYWFGSDIWAVALFSITGVISYVVMILWIFVRAIQWGRYAKASR